MKPVSSRMQTIKCVLVGDDTSGKKDVLVSFARNSAPLDDIPSVFDNYAVTVMHREDPYTLCLFDTQGGKDYDKRRCLCYPQTDIFLVFFSVVQPFSFKNVKRKWIPEVKRYAPSTPIIIVGTQVDLKSHPEVLSRLREDGLTPVTYKQGLKAAKNRRAVAYVECSASTQEGLDAVFQEAVFTALHPPDEFQTKKRRCTFL